MNQQSPFESLHKTSAMGPNMDRFRHTNYLVRRKFLKLLGAAFYADSASPPRS